MRFFFGFFCLLLTSCSSSESSSERDSQIKGEFIYRLHDEYRFIPASPQPMEPEVYPWEKSL